jgi:hypothetical protein
MRKLNRTSVFVALALGSGWLASAQEPSAAALYRTSGAFGLRITVELRRDGAVKMVSPQSDFRNGDQIRLHFVSNVDGYVYALNETPSGETKVIFPTAEAGSNNMIHKAQDYTIPATNGWFRMTGGAGAEKVLMILSPRALPEMESKLQAPDRTAAAVPPPPPPRKSAPQNSGASNSTIAAASGGAVNSTAATVTNTAAAVDPTASGGAANSTSPSTGKNAKSQNPMNTARTDVSGVKSGISLVGGIASIPRDVTSIPGLSRDLVFEDDLKTGTAYISTKPEALSGPVIFSIALVHR